MNRDNPMRKKITALLLLASTGAGWPQAQPPANCDANTPAVNSPNAPPNPGAPVAGANSFTEGQAKSRIESSGYGNVSELRKDDQGGMARQGHEGRQGRQRQPRLPGQCDHAVAR